MPFSNLANILRGATHANLIAGTASATPAQTAAITTAQPVQATTPATVTSAKPKDDSAPVSTGPTDQEISNRKKALAVLAFAAVGVLYYYQYQKTPAVPVHTHKG